MTHDYVIVGAGSAGCVLAHRLSEDPEVSVLLIEAGPPDTGELIHIPLAFSALFRSRYDWDYSSAYEPGADDRHIFLPRGKTLGGSSSINAQIYIRGNPADWDEWAADGCDDWTWSDILPYFKRAEDNERGADALHGAGGPLAVADRRASSPTADAFLAAADALGLPRNPDFNGARQEGFGPYQLTNRNGRRASTAVCYLHPVEDRPNLHVETDLHVTRILFDGTRAVGVVGERLGEEIELRAEREVIVSGGAYNSPQLLTLSGLGRAEELAALGIPQVAELPGVGRNLSDHPSSTVTFLLDNEDSLWRAVTEANLALWAEGGGPLTSNSAEVGGFIRTRPELPIPDVQLHMISVMFEEEALAPPPAHGFSINACVLRPRARGAVTVISPDPLTKPYIVHNYLREEEDTRALVAGVRTMLELAGTSPLSDHVTGPHLAPAGDSDADIEAFVRHTMQGLYHPVGTCAMGTGPDAVVDAACRVRGVEGLRVVDASVFPSVPRGNTNAPTIALAERASDLIRGRTPLREEPAVAVA